MQYEPRALPPLTGELRELSRAMQADRSILVGSSLRDADNGIPVTSHSLFVMPTHALTRAEMVETFVSEAGQGTRIIRTFNNGLRHEIRHHSGVIVNLSFCHQAWMLEAGSMANRVPNGLSSIALDLFRPGPAERNVHVAELYHLDRDEGRITQKVPRADHDNAVALSVQKRYPTYPVYEDGSKKLIHPALRNSALPA